ncbi:efflux RND transporter permease subunit [Myxococcota bacterium]|nr:efflux RND transporter permease subunit [Myxococcota bacterium]
MSLSRTFVHRPTATLIFFLAITLMGLVSLKFMKLDLMPDMEIPVITVVTVYPGASPEDVEKNVTKVLEEQLSTVSGVDEITSKSQENISTVTLKFDWDTNLAEASNDIRDKIGLAKRFLPDDVEEPFLFKFDMSMIPVMFMSIQSTPERYPTLRQFAEDHIVNPLKNLPGVAQVQMFGGLVRQVRVELDRQRIEETGVTYDAVKGVIATANVSTPGGDLTVNDTTFLLRVPGELGRPQELEGLVVGMNPNTGAVVHLRDIATVTDTTEEQTFFAVGKNGPSLMLMVQKQSSANTVTVGRAVLKRLDTLKKTLPKDVEIVLVMDFTKNITRTIDNLTQTVTTGGVLVIIVILLFLRNFKGSLIMAITIPTSMIVSFLFMYLKGYTINMISLTSMSIAIGMVVDNGIVVLENIFQHLGRGERPREAAVAGTQEVLGAIMASTLTTVAIFFPVLFVGGVVGIMFSQMAFVITFTLLTSLLVAMALVPTLSGLLLNHKKPRWIFGWFFDKSELAFTSLEAGYRWLLTLALHNKLITFTIIAAVSLSSILLVPYVGTEYMPQMDSGSIQAFVELPPGTKAQVTEKYVKELAARIQMEVPEVRTMMTLWGQNKNGGLMSGAQQGDNYGQVMVALIDKKDRKRTAQQIAESLQHLTTLFPGASVKILMQDQGAQMMGGQAKPVSIEIYGENDQVAASLANTLEAGLKSIPGVTNIQISRQDGNPEMGVILDRDKASLTGVNMYTAGNTVRTAFNGQIVSRYRENGKEYDIFVRLDPKDRRSLKDLMDLRIPTVTGRFIELGNIATLNQHQGPIAIERKNQQRIVKVEADIMGRDVGSISEDVEALLKTIQVPDGFQILMGGARKDQQESFGLLILAMILGVLLVYFVMAAQFESLRDPFIILFTIPFAMLGALWGFVISGQTLSMLSFVGLIMLVGIVVNNGIVLVDFTNLLRERGLGVIDAVTRGGTSRLRPVLMTTVTTICGMIPLAMSTGEGSEMWVAMATVIIGGLTVSTFITLFFVPVMYTFFEQGRQRRADRRKGRRMDQRRLEIIAMEEKS